MQLAVNQKGNEDVRISLNSHRHAEQGQTVMWLAKCDPVTTQQGALASHTVDLLAVDVHTCCLQLVALGSRMIAS